MRKWVAVALSVEGVILDLHFEHMSLLPARLIMEWSEARHKASIDGGGTPGVGVDLCLGRGLNASATAEMRF